MRVIQPNTKNAFIIGQFMCCTPQLMFSLKTPKTAACGCQENEKPVLKKTKHLKREDFKSKSHSYPF